MSDTLVKCRICGENNGLTRLFCKSCGSKLDMSAVRFKSRGVGRVLRHLLHAVFLLALLAVLGLMLWAPHPEGEIGTEQQGYECYQKILDLYEAGRAGRTLVHDFSEAEVNAYLAIRVDDKASGDASTGRGLALQSINLRFTDDHFLVHIGTSWNFLNIRYIIEAKPFVESRGVKVNIKRVELGRLPIPAPLHLTFSSRMLPIVQALEEEWIMLGNVTRIGLRDRQCRVRVSP